MSNLQFSKQIAKTSLLYVALALALVVALPLLAGLAYAVRFVIPVLIVGGVVTLLASPALRRWLAAKPNLAADYKGLPIPVSALGAHPTHSWTTLEPGTARVGVDALALAALGPVTVVETIPVGSKVEEGDTLFTLCRGRRRLPVKAPAPGTVEALNQAVLGDPTALAPASYTTWVVRLREVGAARQRLTGTALRRWFCAEVDRLTTLLTSSSAAGARIATMADGGKLAPDLADQIDDDQWAEVVARLFSDERG